MSDRPDPPPRVHLTLPGGGATVEARLLGWRQDSAGTWRAEVALTLPASTVTPIPGEDYSHVPRQPATTPARRFVLVTSVLPHGPTTMELHTATCWTLGAVAPHQRVTPVDGDAPVARGMLRFGDTSACDVCKPKP